jgi:hypothetical protein
MKVEKLIIKNLRCFKESSVVFVRNLVAKRFERWPGLIGTL